MRGLPPHRMVAIAAMGFALLPGVAVRGWASGFAKQDDGSTVGVLLSRARTLEQRGRLDLAKGDWAQVLVADPTNAEALAGSARAAKSEGRAGDAAMFLARLRAAHPGDPQLAAMEGEKQGRSAGAELSEAARLARAGDARGAMAIYRRVYGVTPPAGAPALAYYETEGVTEDGRASAIAGLRALADKYPADARYGVALGRLLMGSERTQAEGRTLLEGMPGNADAAAALREPAGTGGQGAAVKAATALAASAPEARPGTTGSAAKSAAGAAAGSASRAVATTSAGAAPATGGAGRQGLMLRASSTQGAGSVKRSGYSGEEMAAFAALEAHRLGEAGQRFRELLGRDPANARALAGMGYVSLANGDLKTAVLFFERAQESGDRSLALTRALVNAEFEFTLQQAAGARAKGDLAGAETQYKAALRERPSDSGALEGLGEVLLQVGRAGEAVPVFAKLTQMRPLSPVAWRGLVLAEAATGNTQAVVATAARVPAEAREPLQSDTAYALTVGAANRASGSQAGATGRTQVARVETPARPVVVKPVPPKAVEAQPGSGSKTASRGTVAAAPVPARSGTPAVPAPPATVAVGAAPPVVAGVPAVAAAAPATSARADQVVAGERVQQAEAALLHGNNAEAAAVLREVVRMDPERVEAWRALVQALHNEGHDAEAAVVVARLPAGVQPVLERDATFETTAGAVYLKAERPGEALRALARAQDVFATQRLAPPPELALQIARLLAARGDDDNLYRQLMYLGERADLSSAQRVQVQMVWTQWAVRRARALAAGGDRRRAVTLLNAAAGAFPGNADVIFAVAEGYSGIGLPREAVALYKAQDMPAAPAREVEAAVVAATAARDFRAAGNWSRMGLQRFGKDAEMLTVAAELEQARGHEGRALTLTEQAKMNAPAEDPGVVLAAELKEARAGQGWATPAKAGGQLSVLLAPAEAKALGAGQGGRPYLPGGGEQPGIVGAAESAPVLSNYEPPSR